MPEKVSVKNISEKDLALLQKFYHVREYKGKDDIVMLEIITHDGVVTFVRQFSKILDDAGYRLFGCLEFGIGGFKLIFYHEDDRKRIDK